MCDRSFLVSKNDNEWHASAAGGVSDLKYTQMCLESSTPSDQLRTGNGTEKRGSTERRVLLLKGWQTNVFFKSLGWIDTSQKMPTGIQLPGMHLAHADGNTSVVIEWPDQRPEEMKLVSNLLTSLGFTFISFFPTNPFFLSIQSRS